MILHLRHAYCAGDPTTDAGAVVSVADDKLSRASTGRRVAIPARTVRTLVVHGAEVAAWVAFYFAIRALVG